MRTIDCIERLLELQGSYMDITQWMVENGFADQVEANNKHRRRERAEYIYISLKKAEQDKKIMLLYFEWIMLPKETIKITCVTENEEKEFTHGL